MKVTLDEKYIDFANNKVIYDYNIKHEYTLCLDQYERPRRIALWFTELKFGIKPTDAFRTNISDIIKSTQTMVDFDKEFQILISKTNMTEKEYAHLIYYSWYYTIGLPFDNMMVFNKNCRFLGKYFIKHLTDWHTNKKELNEFVKLIYKTSDKKEKQAEKEKKLNIEKSGIKMPIIKSLIKNSTLHKDIKDEFFNNMKEKYQDLQEMFEDGIIIHDDTLFDAIGEESNWNTHFSSNLIDFPLNIVTEHFTILYNGKK